MRKSQQRNLARKHLKVRSKVGNCTLLALTSDADIFLFGAIVLFCFIGLLGLFWFGWYIGKRQECPSPYTGLPLRRGADIPWQSMERILQYLHDLKSYDNRMFDLRKAAYCRETGRIFQNAVGWLDTIYVDWRFLQKRLPGSYVSWGSLSKDQQQMIRELHAHIDDFQTEFSSPNPLPKAVDSEYVYTKPGPLYVDLETKVLLGWKEVPGTEFEVLIVQRPIKQRTFNIPKELLET